MMMDTKDMITNPIIIVIIKALGFPTLVIRTSLNDIDVSADVRPTIVIPAQGILTNQFPVLSDIDIHINGMSSVFIVRVVTVSDTRKVPTTGDCNPIGVFIGFNKPLIPATRGRIIAEFIAGTLTRDA
jgi:hypothetical protein